MLDLFIPFLLTQPSFMMEVPPEARLKGEASPYSIGNYPLGPEQSVDRSVLLLGQIPDESTRSLGQGETPVDLEPIELDLLLEVEPEPPAIVEDYQSIIPLPGQLNQIPVFNSNSPEVIEGEGILLSTFPGAGKEQPSAHLNLALEGRFDIFTHHISRPAEEPKTLYQGLIINNPTGQRRRIRILQGLSYLNSEDAPFIDLPSLVEDPEGEVFSGPGSRLVGDLLRGQTQPSLFPKVIEVAPYSNEILFSLPLPPSSARSTYLQVESDGGLYLANLAKYEVEDAIKREVIDEEALERFRELEQQALDQEEALGQQRNEFTPLFTAVPTKTVWESFTRSPSLGEWRTLLTKGQLAEPRDLAPILDPNDTQGIYGRVAGVSMGSQWQTTIVNSVDGEGGVFSIPALGEAVSLTISTTNTGTFDTAQVQSAPMVVRYPDTALEGHGNYLVYYDLEFPLHNPTDRTQQVSVTFQTPIKQNRFSDRLTFFDPPPDQIFYRGAVLIRYEDRFGQERENYVHLVQRRGEQSEPLATLEISSQTTIPARIDFFYPPDATPPQVITIRTLAPDN